MIKRTLYFGNPAYLQSRNGQLVINLPNAQGLDNLSQMNTIPIEDIGIVILDHQQITITQHLISTLLDNNVALITCDNTHHPTGLLLNLNGHQQQSAKFRKQIEAGPVLKKQLWQQTIRAKIINQAHHLKLRQQPYENLLYWAKEVRTGDAENHEARAAAKYWGRIFREVQEFRRERHGEAPNQLLNYGYSILRGICARSLVGSGLLPTLGIFHRNQYNAYCLADDIMEPYRPFVDQAVVEIISNGEDYTQLTTSIKRQLLSLPTKDVMINGQRSPLMIAMTRTTASLAACFDNTAKQISYPSFYENK
jgi:CRISPR-associated protein Cas1